MKKTSFLLALFSIIIVFQNISCDTGNKYPKETQSMDSLQILVIKADSAVKAIDSTKITTCTNHINKDMELIQMSHTDTMSAEATAIFRNFNGIRWALLTDEGKIKPLLTELEKSKKQLDHLSHDMKHGLVAEDSAKIFVSFETHKANELIQVSQMSIMDINRQLPLYVLLVPKADSLIYLLKNHKKI
jgi:hypothetical protein